MWLHAVVGFRHGCMHMHALSTVLYQHMHVCSVNSAPAVCLTGSWKKAAPAALQAGVHRPRMHGSVHRPRCMNDCPRCVNVQGHGRWGAKMSDRGQGSMQNSVTCPHHNNAPATSSLLYQSHRAVCGHRLALQIIIGSDDLSREGWMVGTEGDRGQGGVDGKMVGPCNI